MTAPIGGKSLLISLPTLRPKAVLRLKGLSSIDSTELGKDQLKPVMTDLLGKQGITAGNIMLDNTAKVRLLSAQPSFIERASDTSLGEALKSLDLALFAAPPKDGKQDIYILGDKRNVPVASKRAAAEDGRPPVRAKLEAVPNIPGLVAKNADPIKPVYILNKNNGGHAKMVSQVAWSPDGKFFATASGDKTVKIIDAQTKMVVFTLNQKNGGHVIEANSLAWSPDGKFLATGSDDCTVKIIDTTLKKVAATLNMDMGKEEAFPKVKSIAWSPNGRFLAIGMTDELVNIIDVNTKLEVFSFAVTKNKYTDGNDTNSVAWSPDGRYLAAGTHDDGLTIIDFETKERVITKRGKENNYGIHSVAWSPDGSFLATGSWDGSVDMININNKSVVHVLAENNRDGGGKYSTFSIAWSPDGRFLAAGSDDGTVKIIDTQTKKTGFFALNKKKRDGYAGAPFYGAGPVAFSPDGNFLAISCGANAVEIFDFQKILAASGMMDK